MERVKQLMKEMQETKMELKKLQEEPFDTEEADRLRQELINLQTIYKANEKWIEMHKHDPTTVPVAKDGCKKRHVAKDERLVPEEIRKNGGFVYVPTEEEKICHPLPYESNTCIQDFKVIASVSFGPDFPKISAPVCE